MPIAAKFGASVTCNEGVPLIKSHNDINTWSLDILWQTKNLISSLPQCLWPQNLAT